jgi:Fe-S oxidoreductase
MFRDSQCDFCGECLSRCAYLDFDIAAGAGEFARLVRGERTEWLYDCVTCMACNEYCPNGARPFDLILRRLEEGGKFVDKELLTQMAERFEAKTEPRPVEIKGRVISLCVMTGNMPWAVQGRLFEGVTVLKGLPYFCNILFAHMGNESIIRDRMQKMIDNLAESGASEIVFVHEDCYAAVNNLAHEYGIEVPFRPVHFFEYLRDYLSGNRDKITRLNLKAAYQRPCASRHTPAEVEKILDDIFEMTGVERVARKYDGTDALCCGVEHAGPDLKLFPRGKNFQPYREKNIRDALDHGAQAMVYLCPMCFKALSGQARSVGMINYMVSDICRLALGEKLPEDKPE